MNALTKFIEKQMQDRKMSLRQFAQFVDLAPGHLSHILNGNRKAGAKVLRKISKATGVEHDTLEKLRDTDDLDSVEIRYVDYDSADVSADAQLLAELYDSLPPQKQKIMYQLIMSLSTDLDE